MQVHAHARELDRHGFNEASVAKIAINPMAIQILSSNIYTNKPLAIVRELSANAYDAHVDAGTTDRPFDIWLPTALSPEFRIRDYGTGLSHEDVLDLYVTYFGSTKRESNDFIGAFGLGSKTPLAYSDRFVVSSTHKGIRRDYLVYLNDGGLPVVSFIQEAASDEHDGLDIRVAVAKDDLWSFTQAAEQILPYFPPSAYQCRGAVIRPVEYWLKTDQFAIRKPSRSDSARVVMGNMAYTLDLYEVFERDYSAVRVFDSMRFNLDLFLPIGAVSVQASREALSYDKRTIKVLRSTLEALRPKFEELLEDYVFSNASLPLERWINTRGLRLPDKLRNRLNESVTIKQPPLLFGAQDRARKTFTTKFGPSFYPDSDVSRYAFVWSDKTVSWKRLHESCPELFDTPDLKTVFVRGPYELMDSVATIVGTNIVRYDDLPIQAPPKRLKASKPARIQGLRIFDYYHKRFRDPQELDPKDFDPETTVYVKLAHEKPVDPEEWRLLEISHELRDLHILPYTTRVIGIPRNQKSFDKFFETTYESLSERYQRLRRELAGDPKIQRMLLRCAYYEDIKPAATTINLTWVYETGDESTPIPRQIRRANGYIRHIQGFHNTLYAHLRDLTPTRDLHRGGRRVFERINQLASRYRLVFEVGNSYAIVRNALEGLNHYVRLVHTHEDH